MTHKWVMVQTREQGVTPRLVILTYNTGNILTHFKILIFYANTVAGLGTNDCPVWVKTRTTPTMWF
jgi:hypothetical protein